MLKRIALLLMIFQVVVACSPPSDSTPTLVPTLVGPTSVGPTLVGPTSVGPTSVGPTPVATPVTSNPTGFEKLAGYFFQLPDGSTVVQFNGGDVTTADGSLVTLDPYWISSAPISNEQYQSCVAAGYCAPPDEESNPSFFLPAGAPFPITGITFDQAKNYCAWQGGTLPNSAQVTQSTQGTPIYLSYLFNAYSVGFQYMPEPKPEYQACDFLPGGCTEDDPSADQNLQSCDFLPGGCSDSTEGDTLKPCDLLPGGCSDTSEQPSNDNGLKACDLTPAGCGDGQASDESVLQPCDLLPGGCGDGSSDNGNVTLDPLALQLIGALSGPTVSGFGFYSDDSASGGQGNFILPSGVVNPASEGLHPGNVSFKCIVDDLSFFAPYCQTSAYVASSKDNYPPPVCGNVNLEPLGTYCSSKLPFVNVNVSSEADFLTADPPPANCAPDPANSTADTTRYICTGVDGSTITLTGQSQCSAPADWSPEMTCLAGYTYDAAANLCQYTGGDPASFSCPMGFTYSPDAKCCVAAGDYSPACAPGYYKSALGCVQYSSTYLSLDASVKLLTCQNNNSNGGSSCNVSCGPGEVLDIASCSCNPYKP